jgi:hypothetical protein
VDKKKTLSDVDTLIHWAKRDGFGQEAEDAELEATE